jgi:hypothetical protein
MRHARSLALLAVAGAAAGLASAQPFVVNISGATLLENYVRSNASTNDYIDVDGDGVAGVFSSFPPDQLAPYGVPSASDQYWQIQYRVVGSVNGFIELTRFGSSFVTTNDADVNGILGARPPAVQGVATTAYINRTRYIDVGAFTGPYNQNNAGGAPVRSDIASLVATTSLVNSGIRIDIAPMDVPTRWAVQIDGQPFWGRTPGAAGYGLNPRRSTNRIGTSAVFTGANAGNLPNTLPGLNGRTLFDPNNPGAADANTLFDNPFAWAVICPVVNFGTGITQITTSQLQHYFVTGRGSTGENLMVCTRDVGSGTRNAFYNCLGIDPSWGVGDNVGTESTQSVNNNLGANFTPTNKGSNGGMEATLRNARLGIGYVGGERGVTGSGSGSWLSGGALEIPSTRNDLYGGTAYVRPTADSVVHNGPNGWVIGGPAILATLGDPLSEPVSEGGLGLTRPRMPNPYAARYVNNIRRSIEAFVSVPGDAANFGMPGEYAATQFTLPGALDFVHDFVTPTQLNANPGLNASLQSYTLANSVYNNPRFASFIDGPGKVPTRTTGAVYSDGVPGGINYLSQGGSALAYGSNMPLRNKIAGDFDGNGLRNTSDIPAMIAAWRQRHGGPAWSAPAGSGTIAGAPGSDACIELLGDFDGDGSFTAADVRYFADGLAMSGGNLDRRAGFIAVDAAFGGNFFGTTLAHGAYTPGASRADLVGSGGINPGWAPVGANGVVNAADIDYVYRQFRQNPAVTDGELTWSDLSEAASGDLSADLTGDLKVNQDDIAEILSILATSLGDVNLDGTVDGADCAIATANLGQTGLGWAGGDVDGDGTVTAADIQIICGGTPCDPDLNQDGNVDQDDVSYLINVVGGGANPSGIDPDFNRDGNVDQDDVSALINVVAGGPCP